jgi:putative transposase
VSLAGNRYSVDPSLIGRRIELRFEPEDLTRLDVFWEGRPVGVAVPFVIGRHVPALFKNHSSRILVAY